MSGIAPEGWTKPASAGTKGITALERRLESYVGEAVTPGDLAAFWQKRWERVATSAAAPVECEPAGFDTPVATYERLHVLASDGQELVLRYVCPRGAGGADRGPDEEIAAPRVPTAVMTHDVTCGPRGWHHLTRFAAIGYAALELERRPWSGDICGGWQEGPDGLAVAQQIDDMLTAVAVAASLPRTDAGHLALWGEGFAGGLAIDAAAICDAVAEAPNIWRVAALNPMPADIRATWEAGPCKLVFSGLTTHFRVDDPTGEHAGALFDALAYVDGANLAGMLETPLLLGTSLMDDAAIPQSQFALYDRVKGPKHHICYPKWAHERVNDFEEALMNFLHV